MTLRTTKMISRFVYQAEVVPKRSRVPRRIDLSAPTEYEIETVSADDLAEDAVLVQPRLDEAGHAGAYHLSLAAHRGRLYSPMKTVEEEPGGLEQIACLPSTRVEDYIGRQMNDYVAATATDDPILHAYDYDRSSLTGLLPGPHVTAEDAFDGKVLWSNRATALARHHEAARDMLFAGDHVYVRRPEPTWSAAPRVHDYYDARYDGARAGVVLTGLVPHNSRHRFRLDRLDEAVEWMKRIDKAAGAVHGEIIHADFSLLRRDDEACTAVELLEHSLLGRATVLMPRLPPDAATSWHALASFLLAAPRKIFRPDIATRPADFKTHIVRLAEAISDRALPRLYEVDAKAAAAALGEVRDRLAFAAERRPAIDAADELAIASLGAAP